jgi:hypothetical protein
MMPCPKCGREGYGVVIDGTETCIEWLDEYIAELREVLQTAATEVPETVARKLKRAA